jgi:hypothetical protein
VGGNEGATCLFMFERDIWEITISMVLYFIWWPLTTSSTLEYEIRQNVGGMLVQKLVKP